MGRLVLAFLVFVAALAVIKAVIVALILAGLIFRTKATLGLLFIGAMLTLIAAQPLLGLGVVAVIVIVAIVKSSKGDSATPVIEDQSQPQ